MNGYAITEAASVHDSGWESFPNTCCYQKLIGISNTVIGPDRYLYPCVVVTYIKLCEGRDRYHQGGH